MPKVRLLNKETAELIAAGEVIERPASVIKELIENAVDSGAHSITVEIKDGGITYLRVTDNGCGIHPDDVPTAFLRHATSKINGKEDLDRISTLGFRGEALASICAVARVEIMTKTPGSDYGIRYCTEGSREILYEQCGCPDGTTIIVRDIFYNVPARLKFLKKDVSEGNAVADITNKIALSHPEISFKFIRSNRQEFITPGDGRLYSSVYSVMGKQFAASMLTVDYELSGIKIDGFTVKPLFGRQKRTFQFFFINGRYVKSFVLMSALEEAYKNTIMEGKFPACVIRMTVSPSVMDVNVHPAKIEVRFSDDRVIYDAVYFSVKNAILADTAPSEMKIPNNNRTYDDYVRPEAFDKPPGYIQTSLIIPAAGKDAYFIPEALPVPENAGNEAPDRLSDGIAGKLNPAENNIDFRYISASSLAGTQKEKPEEPENPADGVSEQEIPFRLIGEAFGNYIIAETEGGILFADKHAAHERIIFENLKSGVQPLNCQLLLEPEDITLECEDVTVLQNNSETVKAMGFDYKVTASDSITVSGIPAMLDGFEPAGLITEVARNLYENRSNPEPDIMDDIYHTIACKAALKANDITSPAELSEIIRTLLINNNIRYCPHGRPVLFRLTKYELEKQFKRKL